MQFISPPQNKRYTIGDVITLDWTTTKTTAYVSLVVDYPIYIPFISPLWQGTLDLQQDYTMTVSSAILSSFPVHFEVAYDCVLNFYCTVERGPQFFITQTYSQDFNYDAVTGKAESVINIFTEDCESFGFEKNATCPEDTFYTPVCQFCSAGGELQISLDCDNCWMKTDVTLSVITFSLNSVSMELYSDFDLNLDFLLNVTGKYSKQSDDIPLATSLPIFAFALDLYLFKAEIGKLFTVVLSTSC